MRHPVVSTGTTPRSQMLLHVLTRMGTVGSFGHVQEAAGVFRGLRDAAVSTEIHALIQHGCRTGLVKRATEASGIHAVHATVVFVSVESASLILALDEHLGSLHQTWTETRIVGSRASNASYTAKLVVLLLVLLEKHHELLELGHWI